MTDYESKRLDAVERAVMALHDARTSDDVEGRIAARRILHDLFDAGADHVEATVERVRDYLKVSRCAPPETFATIDHILGILGPERPRSS